MLDAAQLEHWRRHRYLLLEGALSPPDRTALSSWVDDLAGWPETPGRWMKYFESGPGGARQLCRVENFLPFHAGLRGFLARPALLELLAALLDEPALLFKEKINYKLPGGAGFAPHQDAPAFASFGQRYHVTLMVGVDATTPGNGCLELVRGHGETGLLPQAEDGTLQAETVAALDWTPLPTLPGDLLLFDSYLPHRSGPNRSTQPRRALYVTWNRRSEGDRRADYYERKRRVFPPECERDPGAPLSEESRIFNLGNPIR